MHDLMTNLEIELDHLVNLMAAPFQENLKAYCWAKAVYLSEHNPTEYGELPARLKAAMTSGLPVSLDAGPNL